MSDVLSHLRDWAGVVTDTNTTRMAYRAIQNALDNLMQAHQWTYYLRRFRLTTVASYSTGSIAYTHSTRTVTLTTGTWPSWAALGVLKISNVHYPVLSQTSNSAVVLGSDLNPGDDVASGTEYTLYRDTYSLPADFVSIESRVTDLSTYNCLTYCDQNDFNSLLTNSVTPGTPWKYTLTRDRSWLGPTNPNLTMPGMAFVIRPPSDSVRNYEFFYRFRPRDMTLPAGVNTTGTVSTSSTTVTGVGTAFTQDMVGCVIRFGTTQNAPDGRQSAYKYQAQRFITAVTSATVLSINSALTTELSGVKHEVSDPVDVEPGGMWNAFLRRVEYELSIQRHKDDPKAISEGEARYIRAVREAMATDSRGFRGEGRGYRDRLGTISFPA